MGCCEQVISGGGFSRLLGRGEGGGGGGEGGEEWPVKLYHKYIFYFNANINIDVLPCAITRSFMIYLI